MSVTYARANVAPQLLTGTDLRAEALPGLRKPESWSATYAFALRRSAKGTDWLTRSLLDPMAFNMAYTHGNATTEYSAAQSSNSLLALTYNVQMRRRGFRLPLGGLVDGMPSFIRASETGRALRSGTVSLVPSNLRFLSTLSRDWAEQQSFSVPIVAAHRQRGPARAGAHAPVAELGRVHLAADRPDQPGQRRDQHPGSPGLPGLDLARAPGLQRAGVPLGHSGGGGAGPDGDQLALQHAAGHLLAGTSDPLGQQLRALPEPHVPRAGAGRRGHAAPSSFPRRSTTCGAGRRGSPSTCPACCAA